MIPEVLAEKSAERTLIWDLGGAFHMKPTSSMHWCRWCPVEKALTRLFCATSRESRPETFQTASGPFQEFRKKIFPRHKPRSWEGINRD